MIVRHVEEILCQGVVVVILIPGRMGRSELDVGKDERLGRYCCRLRTNRAGHQPRWLDLAEGLPQSLTDRIHSSAIVVSYVDRIACPRIYGKGDVSYDELGVSISRPAQLSEARREPSSTRGHIVGYDVRTTTLRSAARLLNGRRLDFFPCGRFMECINRCSYSIAHPLLSMSAGP